MLNSPRGFFGPPQECQISQSVIFPKKEVSNIPKSVKFKSVRFSNKVSNFPKSVKFHKSVKFPKKVSNFQKKSVKFPTKKCQIFKKSDKCPKKCKNLPKYISKPIPGVRNIFTF